MFGVDDALIGAGIGGLLGAFGGGSKPAGNTTSTTTTIQDVPAWLKPYITDNLNLAQSTRAQLTGDIDENDPRFQAIYQPMVDEFNQAHTDRFGFGLYDARTDAASRDRTLEGFKRTAREQFKAQTAQEPPPPPPVSEQVINAALPTTFSTLNGDYLDPAKNPFLKSTFDAALNSVIPGIDSIFAKGGRYGSGAQAFAREKAATDLATGIFGGNYQAERGRQFAGSLGMPSFALGTEQAALYPYVAFNSLIPSLHSSVGTATQPYFTNPVGNALSGALAGGILGSRFGSTGGGGIDTFGSAGAGDLLGAMGFLA